jgi:NADH-quinone oxidoreductase subunit L
MTVIAIIGALTLLIAGFSALTQRDIKRVLAYSTISQIGYMFLALGVGAWSAGIFHFVIHAFFKALLFLGAGVVIHALHDEHDMFKMGGLRKQLPVTFWTFLIGSACLAAIPLITAGFYSKDAILWAAFASEQGGTFLWLAGFVGALVTAFYTFRMVFVTFFGNAQMEADHKPGMVVKLPLIVLAILSLLGGFIETPHSLGGIHVFSGFMTGYLPSFEAHGSLGTEILLQVVTSVMALLAVLFAYQVYVKQTINVASLSESKLGSGLHMFLTKGWQFDALYDTLLVKPFGFIARINRADVVDKFFAFLAFMAKAFHYLFSLTQTGRLRWYATGLALGAILTLTIMVFL